jgi:hypothetical protein
LNFTIGKIGPNISSFQTGILFVILVTIVGSKKAHSKFKGLLPPVIIFAHLFKESFNCFSNNKTCLSATKLQISVSSFNE